jgi:hypothetical protein
VRLRRIGFVFQEYYALILNRLRLEAKGDLAPGLELDLQYDNELLLGSYLGTAEFRSAKDSAAPAVLAGRCELPRARRLVRPPSSVPGGGDADARQCRPEARPAAHRLGDGPFLGVRRTS